MFDKKRLCIAACNYNNIGILEFDSQSLIVEFDLLSLKEFGSVIIEFDSAITVFDSAIIEFDWG